MVGEHQSFSNVPGASVATIVPVQTKKYWIKSIELANTTATDAKVTLHLVRSGDTAGVKSQIVPNSKVIANEPIILNDLGTMMVGDIIQGVQETTSAITVHITLVEVL